MKPGIVMPRYQRCRIPGGTYFFTVNLADRASRILVDQFDLLRLSIQKTKNRLPFCMNAWVVLPDHMHCIWTLPKNDNDFSKRWWMIKSRFSREYRQIHGGLGIRVWQKRFWEHAIRNEKYFIHHMDYIHINPLKHGHVNQIVEWPYSSFHHMVSKGFYSLNWACNERELGDINSGE